MLSVAYGTSTAQVLFIVTMLQHINNVVYASIYPQNGKPYSE